MKSPLRVSAIRLAALGVFGAATVFALGSCAVGPDFVRPEAPSEKQYTHGEEPEKTATAAGREQRFDSNAKIPDKWWRLFHPTKLDAVVDGALDRSPTLQAAMATLRQSHQAVLAGEGIFYPHVDGSLSFTRERSNPSSFGVNVSPSEFNLFTLSGTVSYALDIFGGNRRAVEGLKAQEQQQRYSVLAAYLTLTGNLVNGLIARAAYQAEIDATLEVITVERQQVSMSEANVRAGTASEAALLSLRAQLAATEATLPPLSQRLSQTEHLLATLSGQAPARWIAPEVSFADLRLPEDLPRSLPSELARQRPDILMSEAQLHAASAQVGVATAALYPSFAINGNAGLINTSPGNLFSTGSSLWGIGPSVTAPIFHGGTLLAQKQEAVEAYQAALANYRQTVLGGLQQVADQLRALEHDAELVEAQESALHWAESSLKLVQANYRSGALGYVQLLVAQAQYYQAKIGFLQGAGQRLQDTVALFTALGGGWWRQSTFPEAPSPRKSGESPL